MKEGGKKGRNVDSHIQPLAKSITLANSPPFSGACFLSGDAIVKHCVRISLPEMSDGGLYLGFNILHDVNLSCIPPTSWKIHHTHID